MLDQHGFFKTLGALNLEGIDITIFAFYLGKFYILFANRGLAHELLNPMSKKLLLTLCIPGYCIIRSAVFYEPKLNTTEGPLYILAP